MLARAAVCLAAFIVAALNNSADAQMTTTYKGLTIAFHQNFAVGTIPRPTTGGEPCYDYSAFLMKDGTNFRLFHGGRWRSGPSDGDHTFERRTATSGGGNINNWLSAASLVQPSLNPPAGESPSPLWRQGVAVGWDPRIWDSGNSLEPECIKVGGTYYLYTQVEIRPNDFIDVPSTETAITSADRIRVHTSNNGESNWTKVFPQGQNRGVVVNLPAATRRQIKLTHHEMIYEAANPNPWALYVYWINNGAGQGYVRIRSNSFATFDWNARQNCSGTSQIGNQIGYCNVPGGRLYLRITHVANGAGRRVPTFQFSSDGLSWGSGSTIVQLVGHPSLNNYFLGFSTVNGTGELEALSSTNFNMLYASSASTSAGAPGIYGADIWLGKSQLSITGTLIP